jgi:hypothetical protein
MIFIIFSAEFRCSYGQFVAKRWRCDDGSNERDCTGVAADHCLGEF